MHVLCVNYNMIYVYCIFFTIFVNYVGSVSYNLNISPEEHVNVVDERFLSFTVDPGLLFAKYDEDMSKDSKCMATALTPAFLRLSGPSTDYMTFYNFTVTINDPAADVRESTASVQSNRQGRLVNPDLDHLNKFLIITHTQWLNFVHWAQSAGFSLVFGLNDQEKTENRLWDPNSALSILTIADHANLSNIYWELGHKCHNKSIDEYLTDMETLRVVMDTFSAASGWQLVAGDGAGCVLTTAEFREYYSLAVEMVDAILMNGHSSGHHLTLMSEQDRYSLLRLLGFSPQPLWFTEPTVQHDELDRAADWINSLGHAARNGFSVHFRELRHDELHNPTLSFYMALLYKNLVGSRVIDVDSTRDLSTAVFAHCTTLRHKIIPGAVTIYSVNMREHAARVRLSWTRRENGGDVMQFILATNKEGKIIVNGKEMQTEGDILPVVKRVRPYKSLILNLPSKSFGFWVLAKTNIKACKDFGPLNSTTTDTGDLNLGLKKTKRSVLSENEDTEESEIDISEEITNYNVLPALQERIDTINKDLKIIQKTFKKTSNVDVKNSKYNRIKRQLYVDEKQTALLNKRKQRKPMSHIIDKIKDSQKRLKPKRLLQRLLELHSKHNPTETLQNQQENKDFTKRYRHSKLAVKPQIKLNDEYENRNKITRLRRSFSDATNHVRSPRYVFRKEQRDVYRKINKIEDENLEKNKKINDFGVKHLEYFNQLLNDSSTEFTVEDTIENVSKEPVSSGSSLVDKTVWKFINFLMEMNTIVKRFWQMNT